MPSPNASPPPARRSVRSSDGQTLVEFALVIPLVILLLLAIFQLGRAFAESIQVTNAAREGARKALISRNAATGVQGVVNAAKGSTWSLDPSKMDVSVDTPGPWTGGQTVAVTVTYPYSINIMGMVVAAGTFSSSSSARVE
jgi:Flp pilus assembly protein TadG